MTAGAGTPFAAPGPEPFPVVVRLEAPGDELAVRHVNRAAFPGPEEAAITDAKRMLELQAVLRDLDIRLAYDDFGAGQARLLELVEVPSDYLKFDMGLIRGIHEATVAKQRIVEALVKTVRELVIVPIAEGIESEQECAACRQIGFELGQGYYFGKPAAVEIYAP